MTEDGYVDGRGLLFQTCPWYVNLVEDSEDYSVLWRVTRSEEPAWWKGLLEVAGLFAKDHGLLATYQRRLASVPLRDLTQTVADVEHRSAVSPIWEIANELIVARYLERVLGWTYRRHEPAGHRGRKGDWEFASTTGREVFVEVKSLAEPPARTTGVYSRGIATQRLTSVLKGAYKQLPRDDRATMVVVVGTTQILGIPYGIMHGDLFQTLYGRMEVTFNVMPHDPDSVRMGPSFRDRFFHSKKHRRLGCSVGLAVGGMDHPGLGFYVIHNPFSDKAAQLKPEDFDDIRQFWVDSDGLGQELPGAHPDVQWSEMAEAADPGGPGGEANIR